MLESLLSVLWYNGYEYQIQFIYEYIKSYNQNGYNIPFPGHIDGLTNSLSDDPDKPDRILWSVLVMEYGDYGTSPRCGWIEHKNKNTIIKQIEKWVNR